MVLWAVLSLAHLPPLAGAVANAESLSVALAVPGMLLYGYAAARYLCCGGAAARRCSSR